MDGTAPRRPQNPDDATRVGRPMQWAELLAALIALADVLLWQVTPGLLLGGAWTGLGDRSGGRKLWQGALRLIRHGTTQTFNDLYGTLRAASNQRKLSSQIHSIALGWALPLGAGLIFLGLFLQANPLIENWLLKVPTLQLPDPSHLLFWVGMALIC